MFKANILLLNNDPVFNSLTWEILDLFPGLNTRIVRQSVDMASLLITNHFDLLIFDDDTEKNLEMAITFRHHFPSMEILAIIGPKPTKASYAEARDKSVYYVHRNSNFVLMGMKLFRALRTFHQRFNATRAALPTHIGYSLVGDLKIFSPPDLLQMVCMTGRSGCFHFRSKHGKAEIYIRSGSITHSIFEKLEGEPALSEVFRWDNGRFYFEEGKLSLNQTITRPWSHVIVDALKHRDEAETLAEI